MSKDSDIAKIFNTRREERAEKRRLLGKACPACMVREPKRSPTILLPGQHCYCGYRDQRIRKEQP